MRCPRCNRPISPNAHFCSECGAEIGRTCARCQSKLPHAVKFCVRCGHKVEAVPPARSPESYTPKHLVEKILTARSSLLGERKQVTVLFADLKASMEQLADRDSEDALLVLDPVLEMMMEAVHRYEGTVNQVMGDGIMALFGAPLALEDHAVRGCFAALRMQESLKRYSERIELAGGGPVHIRVGLNSGQVVVRSIGSDLRMDYTAVGPSTHLAARMEQIATPGSILITAPTLALVEGYVQVRELGAQRVKGVGYPMQVYELVGPMPVTSRFRVAAARGLATFVDRVEERQELERALEQTRAGDGQVVAVVGEPGVGKSRLIWELAHSAAAEGFRVLEGGAVSFGQTTPYLPMVGLLKACFEIEPNDDPEKIREKVVHAIDAHPRSRDLPVAPILWLLDVPVDDPEWLRLDPAQRRRRTLEAMKRLLVGYTIEQPLLLIMEDLHWVDSETQAVLDDLVESLPSARLLLVVSFRREYRAPWSAKASYRQIRVDPLPRPDASQLLDSLLDPAVGPTALKSMLVERTEGNPFFIEESVRTLLEVRTSVEEPGVDRTPERFEIPATVQAVIAARIDRLAPGDKALLQATSVIGTDVAFPLLSEVVGEPENVLLESLARLRAGEFLYESRLFPELEYSFRHSLTQEVAYGTLLSEQRRELHGRVVVAMEKVYGERAAEQVERLAHHARQGALWPRAAAYFHEAGLQALARSANSQAAAFLSEAMVALGRMPAGREVDERSIDVRFDLRNALTPLGLNARVLEHLREAQALAERLGDRRRQGRALSFMTNGLYLMGEYRAAIDTGHLAWAIAEELDDLSLRTATQMYVGRAHESLGSYREAAEIYRRAVESLEGRPVHDRLGLPVLPAVFARSLLVGALTQLGEFGAAAVHAAEAVRIAEVSKQPDNLFWACRAAALIMLGQDAPVAAAAVLERALAVCRASDLTTYVAAASSDLGLAYVQAGRIEEGLPLLEYGASQTAARRQPYHPQAVLQLAEGSLLAGRLADARDRAEQALQLARERTERGREAHALRLLAEAAARGDTAERARARQLFEAAAALAEKLGMRPCLAACLLGIGELLQQGQDRHGARTVLSRAVDELTAMQLHARARRARESLATLL